MNNTMAYIYTGEMMIENKEIENVTFNLMYDALIKVIAKKLSICSDAVEICKFSCEPGKAFAKANYKLHYNVAINDVTNAVYKVLDKNCGLNITSVNYKATGDRLFNIDINITAKTCDEEYWRARFVPSTIEEEVSKVIPEDLRPVVKFNIFYPVTTMATYSI